MWRNSVCYYAKGTVKDLTSYGVSYPMPRLIPRFLQGRSLSHAPPSQFKRLTIPTPLSDCIYPFHNLQIEIVQLLQRQLDTRSHSLEADS